MLSKTSHCQGVNSEIHFVDEEGGAVSQGVALRIDGDGQVFHSQVANTSFEFSFATSVRPEGPSHDKSGGNFPLTVAIFDLVNSVAAKQNIFVLSLS